MAWSQKAVVDEIMSTSAPHLQVLRAASGSQQIRNELGPLKRSSGAMMHWHFARCIRDGPPPGWTALKSAESLMMAFCLEQSFWPSRPPIRGRCIVWPGSSRPTKVPGVAGAWPGLCDRKIARRCRRRPGLCSALIVDGGRRLFGTKFFWGRNAQAGLHFRTAQVHRAFGSPPSRALLPVAQV